MKTKTRLCKILIVVLVSAAPALSDSISADLSTRFHPAAAKYVPGEVLVKFKPMITASVREAAVMARGHSVLANLDQPGWVRLKVGAGQTVDKALTAYRNDPDVECVQPNYIYHLTAVPNDTQYGQLWAFKNTGQIINNGTFTPNFGTPGDDIDIEKAWDHITDCSSVVVAVVDSGVNYDQEDLAGNMWNGGAAYPNHGYDFVDDDDDPMDLLGHGTHVAGIIGAEGNNAKGTSGVCWKAGIMAVRVMDSTGLGTTADIIQGVNFAVANGAKVMNMSLGGPAFDNAFSDAITDARTNDVVVVVAAGNDGSNNDVGTTPFYPCDFPQPNLLCVAALDQNYRLAGFSNYGSASVDVGAPGANILSAWAGTEGMITDSLTSGWTVSTTTSGGWANETLSVNGVPTPLLVDPGTYPTGQYNNGTDDRAYKSFDLAGVDVALLRENVAINVRSGDYFRIGYSSGGGDPFAGGIIDGFTGVATYPSLIPLAWDISDCIGANCGIGFQLQSDSSLTDLGAAITGFGIGTLTLDTTTYKVESGTSMASPEVAGLAAMLRARNPQYTYADVVNSIRQGGRAVASLAGKTTTGKAIDVMSSLAYINPPTGLKAAVK